MACEKENRAGGSGAVSEDGLLGRLNISESTPSIVSAQEERLRAWLLGELRCSQIKAQATANEAEAIHLSLERQWIGCNTAATWGLMTGVLTPAPPPMDHWAEAAIEYRRQRWGATDIITRREVRASVEGGR